MEPGAHRILWGLVDSLREFDLTINVQWSYPAHRHSFPCETPLSIADSFPVGCSRAAHDDGSEIQRNLSEKADLSTDGAMFPGAEFPCRWHLRSNQPFSLHRWMHSGLDDTEVLARTRQVSFPPSAPVRSNHIAGIWQLPLLFSDARGILRDRCHPTIARLQLKIRRLERRELSDRAALKWRPRTFRSSESLLCEIALPHSIPCGHTGQFHQGAIVSSGLSMQYRFSRLVTRGIRRYRPAQCDAADPDTSQEDAPLLMTAIPPRGRAYRMGCEVNENRRTSFGLVPAPPEARSIVSSRIFRT